MSTVENQVERQAENQVEALYREHGHRVLGYLARRVQPADDAADLLSEVMLVTWRRRHDLPEAPDDVLWVFGVARNVLANHHRAAVRLDAATVQLRRLLATATAGNTVDVDTSIDIARALQELPALDREILTLSLWEELTSAEIGTVLGMSAVTVRSRSMRARRRLRHLLPPPDSAPENPLTLASSVGAAPSRGTAPGRGTAS